MTLHFEGFLGRRTMRANILNRFSRAYNAKSTGKEYWITEQQLGAKVRQGKLVWEKQSPSYLFIHYYLTRVANILLIKRLHVDWRINKYIDVIDRLLYSKYKRKLELSDVSEKYHRMLKC